MADLRGALLATAAEADKMQKEIAQLRTKLKNAADCLSSIVNVLSED